MSTRHLDPYHILGIFPRLPEQVIDYGVRLINAPKAWVYSRGDNIRVGIIDTGIDMNHPDLKENYKGGYNFIKPGELPYDDYGHGTHVAGIIGGIDNQIGIVGVAPRVDLYALKAFNSRGKARDEDIIEAIYWAIDNRLHVLNLSMGGPDNNPQLREAIERAVDCGITMVAAAGNRRGMGVDYPARWTDLCIAVGAIDRLGRPAKFSASGPEVDLVAPGVDIYSTYPNNRYVRLSGTSMATPHVTGCVCLLQGYVYKQKKSLLTPQKIQEILVKYAENIGLPGGTSIFRFRH